MNRFNYKKAVQALNFFAIKEAGKINRMKAIKLIWLAERYHIRHYAKPIFNDVMVAMKNGIVLSAVKDLTMKECDFIKIDHKEYRDNFIEPIGTYDFKSINDVDSKVFSQSNRSVFELIYETYGIYDQFTLSEISHSFPEWKRFKDAIEKQGLRKIDIKIEDLFEEDDLESPIFKDKIEILNNAKDIFLESYREINSCH